MGSSVGFSKSLPRLPTPERKTETHEAKRLAKRSLTSAPRVDLSKHAHHAWHGLGERRVLHKFDPYVLSVGACPYADRKGDWLLRGKAGDHLEILDRKEEWCFVRSEASGKEGYFPAQCVGLVPARLEGYTKDLNGPVPEELDLTRRPMAEIVQEWKYNRWVEKERLRKEAEEEAERKRLEEEAERIRLAPWEKMWAQCREPWQVPQWRTRGQEMLAEMRRDFAGKGRPPTPPPKEEEPPPPPPEPKPALSHANTITEAELAKMDESPEESGADE